MTTLHSLNISHTDSISKLECFAEEVSNYYHLDDTYFGNIIMCLTTLKDYCSAGYGDQKWSVEVRVFTDAKGLVFSILDKGGLFTPQIIPEEITPELLDENGGEMLFTIGSLADYFLANVEDNTVELVFSTHSMHRELSVMRAALVKEYFGSNIKITSN